MANEWETHEGQHWADSADRYTRILAAFGDVVTQAAAYEAGQRVLDIGCGNGDITVAAALAVGATGSVTGVDLSPAMLAVAHRRAQAAGVDNVTFSQADAATFRPDLANFDRVVSRFGVMFFDDPASALGHIRSLMAPGARITFVCWRELFANEWMIVPGAAVAEVLPLPSGGDPTAPGPFAFADSDRLTTILRAAGFGSVHIEPFSAPVWMGHDAIDAVGFLRTTGLGRAVFDGAAPELIDEARARAEAALTRFETPDGVLLSGAAWLVTASA